MFQGVVSETPSTEVRVACIGESMLMFAPPPHELIEHCTSFNSYLGGSEANVAIGLERLGLHAGWIGKLTANSLGRKIVNEVRSHGVDTGAVVWTTSGRIGTFFFEFGAAPRPMRTIYDRANSSAATLIPDEIDWAYLAGVEWVHLTGITPALSASCLETVREILKRKEQLSIKVALDVNYRELLWDRDSARETLTSLLPQVDLLAGTEADLRMLAHSDGDCREVLAGLVEAHDIPAAVMTLHSRGSLALDKSGYHESSGYRVETVNRLGCGDAFMAGLIFGVANEGLPSGLRYGSAMAALKHTVPQNTPIIEREDVERLLRGEYPNLVR